MESISYEVPPGRSSRVPPRARKLYSARVFQAALALILPASFAGEASGAVAPLALGDVQADGRQIGIRGLATDGDGFLWVPGDNGLCRFDGTAWACVVRDCAGTVVSDAHGAVWACAARGTLLRVRGFSLDRRVVRGLPPAFQIVAAVGDQLVLSAHDGTYLWRTTSGAEPARRVLPTPSSAAAGSGAVVWLGGTSGLFRRVGETPAVRIGAATAIAALARAADGRIFVGPETGGIDAYDEEGRMLPARFSLRSARPTALRTDDKRRLVWMTFYGGVAAFSWDGGEPLARRQMNDGIPYPLVNSLLLDAVGIWVGTAQGLARFAVDPAIRNFGRREGTDSDASFALVAAPNGGSIWMTQTAGLTQWGRTGPRNFAAQNGLRHIDLRTVALAPDGTVWAAGANSGLSRLDIAHDRFLPISLAGAPPGLKIHTLRWGPSEVLWMGLVDGGLAKMEGDRFVPVVAGTPGRENRVFDLLETGQGVIWLALQDGSVKKVVGTQVSTWPLASEPAAALALHLDADQSLWVATEGNGLFRFDKNGRLARLTERHGLADNRIDGIIADDDGWLWLSSPRGLFRINRSQADATLGGWLPRVLSIPYQTDDGLRSNEAARGYSPSSARDARGRLWFPTVKGAVAVDPRALSTPAPPNRVFFTSVQIDGVSIAGSGENVTSRNGAVAFRFISPSLWSPARVRYRYRLEGLNDKWVDNGRAAEVRLANVAPGSYKMSVQAYLVDAPARTVTADWRVTLRPQLYRRPWFIFLGAVALLAVTAGALRNRARRRIELRDTLLADRARIARDIHDSLEQDLSGMKMHADAAALWMDRDASRAREHLNRVVDLVGDGMVDVRNAIWGLHAAVVPGSELARAIELRVRRIADSAGLPLRFTCTGRPPELPSLLATQLVYVAREAAANAAKHARPSSLEVALEFTQDPQIRLTIRDDGLGLGGSVVDENRFAGGMGIAGMRQRVEMIGGTLTLRSPSAGGTVVEVTA